MFNLNIYKDKVRLTSHAEFFCVCFSACSVNVDFFTVLFKANTLKLQFSSDVIKGGEKKNHQPAILSACSLYRCKLTPCQDACCLKVASSSSMNLTIVLGLRAGLLILLILPWGKKLRSLVVFTHKKRTCK